MRYAAFTSSGRTTPSAASAAQICSSVAPGLRLSSTTGACSSSQWWMRSQIVFIALPPVPSAVAPTVPLGKRDLLRRLGCPFPDAEQVLLAPHVQPVVGHRRGRENAFADLVRRQQ